MNCATAHENEVVGLVTYTGDGAFPGIQALSDYAVAPCVDGLRDVRWHLVPRRRPSTCSPLTPSDATWVKGHRTIACVVVTIDGSMLTGIRSAAPRR